MQLCDQIFSRRSSGQGYSTMTDVVACVSRSPTVKLKTLHQQYFVYNNIWGFAASSHVLWKNVWCPVLCWWNSSIGIMPRLRVWFPRIRCSTPGRGKTSFLQSNKTGTGTNPALLSTGPEAFSLSPGAREEMTWIWSLAPSRIEENPHVAILLLPYVTSRLEYK